MKIDDSELDRNYFSPVCSHCKHYDAENVELPERCKAFFEGIPDEIWAGKNDHKKPYKGDHGIQFEPAEV